MSAAFEPRIEVALINGRRLTNVKILFFVQTGDCILYKRFDSGTFRGIIDLDLEKGFIVGRSRVRPFSIELTALPS